ncbi:MAG: hypothetical protein AB7O86_05800 [Porticoccaceae bacterium]
MASFVDLAPMAHAVEKKKVGPRPGSDPITGPAFGSWAGRDLQHLNLPGGSMMQFDLSRLTIGDFRMMRDHYQLNASTSVLTFVLHQIDWGIECDDPSIKEDIEKAIRDRWTQLIRAVAQSFWAGYSPTVIEWANDIDGGQFTIDKFKDLPPEECSVNWKEVDGWAPPGVGRIPPKLKVYDGFKQFAYGRLSSEGLGGGWPIPVDNTFWYPLMMENGDYYGRKLLRPAFPAWFFSNLIHLFSNRYYERFGEPTPVGRAPFDETVTIGGTDYGGADAMKTMLNSLRSRGVVVLPSDRDPLTKEFEYSIEYLESQMRGADFERYMSRLDEEMSLAVFTPVLMFRTADVGSYNLGQQHVKVFMWMLNMLAGDLKLYIQKYIVDRLLYWNYQAKPGTAQWVYRKLGKDEEATVGQIVMEVIRSGRAIPNLGELGTAMGMTMEEVTEIQGQPGDDLDPSVTDSDPEEPNKPKKAPTVVASRPRDLTPAQAAIAGAVRRAHQAHRKGSVPEFGYRKQLEAALMKGGADSRSSKRMADAVHARMNDWIANVLPIGLDPAEFHRCLGNAAKDALQDAVA